jgi:NAD(P)H dehydrogenase (quinone)
MTCKVLVLYYSRDGNTRRMANQIARAVDSIDGCEAVLRTVAEISNNSSDREPRAPLIEKAELQSADALIVGSPTRFGNMAAPLKHFFDSTADLWLSGAMTDKPAAVFTSSSTLHGGQESTLFTMMLPLLHHGMVIAGIPYSEAALHHTKSGGTPYGASQVSGDSSAPVLTQDEKTLCSALGKRVARLAKKLQGGLND